MSEQIVQVADAASPTKNMRTIQQTVNAQTVQSEVIVLATGAANGADTYDARQVRALTSSDVITAQGQATLTNWLGVQLTSDASHAASVINSAPTTQYGLVTRNIPSGTQTVSGTVQANQGTASGTAWPVKITDNTNQVPIINTAPAAAIYGLSTFSTLYGFAGSNGQYFPVNVEVSGVDQGIVVTGGVIDSSTNVSGTGVSVFPAVANATQPSGLAESTFVLLSTDLNRNLRTIIQNTPSVTVTNQDSQGRLLTTSPYGPNPKQAWGFNAGWGSFGGW